MKPVKNFLFAVLLVSAMAISTFAGEQDTPGYAPPPPPRQMTTADEGTTVIGSNTDQAGGTMLKTSDYLLFEVLAALLSVY
jgi:hypothetical protein